METENLYEEIPEESIKIDNERQEVVNNAMQIAKKYALVATLVRNVGMNGLVKGTLRHLSSLERPAEKKSLTMVCEKLSQIRSYQDYEALGGEELVNSIASNLPIYAKRNSRGYISNADHVIDIFSELWDIQRTFGDNGSKKPIQRAAKQVIKEFGKSGRQGYVEVLENVVGN